MAYTAEKHVCDYPDNVYDCKGKSETVTGFKCPSPDELPPNAVARRFLPYPRFPLPGDDYAYIVFGVLLAFTSGYFSSLNMMYGPK